LITLRFKSVRELIEMAQALKTCIGESQQVHQGTGKKRDEGYFISRLPLSKKGKSGMFEQYMKKGTSTVSFHHQLNGKMMS